MSRWLPNRIKNMLYNKANNRTIQQNFINKKRRNLYFSNASGQGIAFQFVLPKFRNILNIKSSKHDINYDTMIKQMYGKPFVGTGANRYVAYDYCESNRASCNQYQLIEDKDLMEFVDKRYSEYLDAVGEATAVLGGRRTRRRRKHRRKSRRL